MTLPSFLIVGAAKAGTTALADYLGQHREVYFPKAVKESFFLAGLKREDFPGPGGGCLGRACETLEAYERLFETAAPGETPGEKCVAYLYYHGRTIPRIREILGQDVRIVISLRQPADRAYSNYLHHVRDGLEPLPFEEAIGAARRRLAEGWWWGFDYLGPGFYHDQVKAYLDAFGRERVLVVLYDDFREQPLQIIQQVCRFVGVDASFEPNMSERPNVSGMPKHPRWHRFITGRHSLKALLKPLLPADLRRRMVQNLKRRNLRKQMMDPALRQALTARYRDDILRLQALIGTDLSGWLE